MLMLLHWMLCATHLTSITTVKVLSIAHLRVPATNAIRLCFGIQWKRVTADFRTPSNVQPGLLRPRVERKVVSRRECRAGHKVLGGVSKRTEAIAAADYHST